MTQGNNLVWEYAPKFLVLERYSPRSLGYEKASGSKFFWGLKFEMRDRIANIPRHDLNDIINAHVNHELILEQEAVAKKTRTNNKSAISTHGVVRFSRQKGLVTIPPRESVMGNTVLTSVRIVVEKILSLS